MENNLITKEEFINTINLKKEYDSIVDKLGNILGNIYDSKFIEFTYIIFDKYIMSNFNESAQDTIFWWLYEKDGREGIEMYDEDGNTIPMDTIDDLWTYIKNDRI